MRDLRLQPMGMKALQERETCQPDLSIRSPRGPPGHDLFANKS
jgi:hypothetical protein